MFLKSMEIFGFKSFADRTNVSFEQGITVVVGPNGCGKSNIVDSAKWVLGEKQAKNIRGQKMEDIIFTGTESRKPLSLAEVSLTIDNKSRVVNLDADSVSITRRVFRDGESEYLINKSPVRLKDIEKLLMDTGIGKTSYSVMEQGRIDMILSSRAEDRRYIFEEAAGISKFKLQKKESLKKLSDTSENLERIIDIISEIEREKNIKAKQAEKTKIYLNLKEELKINDIKINFLKYSEVNERIQKISDNLGKYQKEREEVSSRISSISDENERDEKRKNDIQMELFELDKKLHTYKIKVEDIDSKTVKNRKLIDQQVDRKKTLDVEIQERTRNLEGLKSEKEKNIENGEQIKKKIEAHQEELKQLFLQRKDKIDLIHKNRDKIEENKVEVKTKEDTLKRLRNELEVVIKELIDAIDKRKAELQQSEDERLEVRKSINANLQKIEKILLDAIGNLQVGIHEEAFRVLKEVDIDALKRDIDKFESYEDGFRSILFDKRGVHARKEDMDERIKTTAFNIERLRLENNNLENVIRISQEDLERINNEITTLEKNLSRDDNEKNWIVKNIQSLDRQIEDIIHHIENLNSEIKRSEKAITDLQVEIDDWASRLVEFDERSRNLKKKVDEISSKKNELEKKIVSRKETSTKDADNLEKLVKRIGDLEKSQVENNFKVNNIEEYLWTEYEKKIDDLKKLKVDRIEQSEINSEIQRLKKKIQELGPINNLAIEEFADLSKRFDYYNNQKNDIEAARADIVSVLEDIDKTSVEMFVKTFNQIQKNFSNTFKELFEGGHAEVTLVDVENPLESGIDIIVRPPGKKQKSIALLSGGERTMTAIALLFSTYMVKPSPFCFLDEIDAALDEENVGRFLKMLRKFAEKTQFIMVTHNKKTMNVGSSIYGITMEEPGVSKIISVKLDRGDNNPSGSAVDDAKEPAEAIEEKN